MPERDLEELEVVRPGDAAPGRFPALADGSLGPWQGPISWRTLHGPATLVWLLGRPSKAHDVLLPDGSRAARASRTMASMYAPSAEWRLPPDHPDGEHTLGTIEVTDRDLILTPIGRRPARSSPHGDGDAPDLRDDLAADPDFVMRVRDGRFAVATYLAFENQAYRKGSAWGKLLIGFRTAGAFVADVRDLGEDYLQFYCSRFEDVGVGAGEAQTLTAEFDGFVARAGWHRVDDEEEARDLATALALVDGWSGREAAPARSWVEARGIRDLGTPHGGEDAFSAARRLALDGRVSEEEYDRVMALL